MELPIQLVDHVYNIIKWKKPDLKKYLSSALNDDCAKTEFIIWMKKGQ